MTIPDGEGTLKIVVIDNFRFLSFLRINFDQFPFFQLRLQLRDELLLLGVVQLRHVDGLDGQVDGIDCI